ncbi:hypothetical protein F4780DRAFT_536317 [Xylariomycetidae sp. FL0641]|nr:hypothetical protein F4780DRAFT_536317 [Xylariomycetidae sp. FL0641]
MLNIRYGALRTLPAMAEDRPGTVSEFSPVDRLTQHVNPDCPARLRAGCVCHLARPPGRRRIGAAKYLVFDGRLDPGAVTQQLPSPARRLGRATPYYYRCGGISRPACLAGCSLTTRHVTSWVLVPAERPFLKGGRTLPKHRLIARHTPTTTLTMRRSLPVIAFLSLKSYASQLPRPSQSPYPRRTLHRPLPTWATRSVPVPSLPCSLPRIKCPRRWDARG